MHGNHATWLREIKSSTYSLSVLDWRFVVPVRGLTWVDGDNYVNCQRYRDENIPFSANWLVWSMVAFTRSICLFVLLLLEPPHKNITWLALRPLDGIGEASILTVLVTWVKQIILIFCRTAFMAIVECIIFIFHTRIHRRYVRPNKSNFSKRTVFGFAVSCCCG